MKSKNDIKSNRTRRLIIEKAAPIFNKKGISGTSLSDLTAATGLTKGSIYGNFKDKNEVAVCVFQYNVDNLTGYLNAAIEKETSCINKLLAIPKAYRKLYKTMIEYGGCPILNTGAEADDTHQTLRQMTAGAIETLNKIIADLVEAGKRSGEFHTCLDAEKIAQITMSLIEGGSILSKITGKKTYMMNALEQIESLIHLSALPGNSAGTS